LQPPEASGAASSAAPTSSGGGGGAAPGCQDGGFQSIGLMTLMMVVFYLFAIRPQQKKQKEMDALLKSLKKGQKVRTSGGLRGEIVDFKDESGDEIVLRLAEGFKVNILRSHIVGVIGTEAEPKKS
jgi:preprotein translocase subunit YajC